MGKHKKESLEKLLPIIYEICESPENSWFKDALYKKLNVERSNPYMMAFPGYFALLKKQFKIKANKFYSPITNKKLKSELIEDCIKMFWYQVNNDIEQLFVFAFFQMENLLNHYITITKAHEKILLNQNYYTHKFSDTFVVNCHKSFFSVKGDKYDLKKISIWAKIIYWVYDTNNLSLLTSNNFSNLVNIRNSTNHRNSNIAYEVNPTVEFLKNSDYSSFGYYINILKEISKSISKIE